MATLVLLSVAAGLFPGCGQSHNAEAEKPALRAHHIPFIGRAVQHAGVLGIEMSATRLLSRFDSVSGEYMSVGDCDLDVLDAHGASVYHDRRGFRVLSEPSETVGKISATLRCETSWEPPDTLSVPWNGTVRFRVFYRDGSQIVDTTVPATYDPALRPALKLRLAVERRGPGSYRFNMTARRIRAGNREYMPTSQTHDWEVLSAEGTRLWQLSFGQMFSQVIKDVQPADIGGTQSYTDDWDGKANIVGGEVPPGRYRLVGTIPMKPAAVSDTLDFEIR